MESVPKNREENTKINIDEFNNGRTRLKSLPPVLFVELTQNCNLSCNMCRSAKGYSKELDMANSIFDLLERDLFPFASVVDLRGFGESTILKNFEERLRRTAMLVPKMRLVTNALALKRETWALLMEKGANVVVSVDSSSTEIMKKLGRGSFEKLTASLEIGSNEQALNNKGEIFFNTVVSNYNLEELKDIVLLANRFGVKRITMFPVGVKNDNPLNLEFRKEEIQKFIQQAEETAITNNVELRLGASLHGNQVFAHGLPNRCSHPWEYCYIDFAGNIGYCDHLVGNIKHTFGNLKEKSFDEIWNGIKFQELREVHSRARKGGTSELKAAFPHCNWCYKRRYVDFEDDTNREASARVISTNAFMPLVSGCAQTID